MSVVRRQAPADQLTAGLTHFQLPTANKQTNNQKKSIKYKLAEICVAMYCVSSINYTSIIK